MTARVKCFTSLRMFFAMVVLVGHCGFINSTERGSLFSIDGLIMEAMEFNSLWYLVDFVFVWDMDLS